MDTELDKLQVAKIVKIGYSLGVIIPKKNLEFGGLKEGDHLTVWYKKLVKKEVE